MKAVLFDLDETLLDRSGSLLRFCHWQATELLGIEDVNRFVKRFVELDNNGSVWKDRVYQALKSEFSIQKSIDDLVGEYLVHFSNFCQERPGALEAVRQLAEKGYKLGLVSNGKSPFQENNFSALGIDDLFNTVIISEAVGYRKPEPAIFEMACKELAVKPEYCVFVGDNPVADIQGGNALGMYTAFIPSDRYGNQCLGADAVCPDYRDLLSIVENAG